MSEYRVSFSLIHEPGELAPEWRELQLRAECSFFQSWGWIGPWLEYIAIGLDAWAIRVFSQERLVGLGVFVYRDIRRRGIIRSHALYLNEYPYGERNMVIEYNGILAEREHREAVYAEVIGHLFRTDLRLDEVYLGGISDGVELERSISSGAREGPGLRLLQLEDSPARSVNLECFSLGLEAYLATLSGNRRAQIRRSIRLYEAEGPLRLEEATDVHTAMEYFAGLKNLHTRRWQAKGKPGVFANPRWVDFHTAVIRAGFPVGTIQLLKVASGERVIGYLYNLVWRRHVYVLQTGFDSGAARGEMPGYVVHALAIVHNKGHGMSVYDLMHGDSLYKQLLCNQQTMLHWVVVQRRRLRFNLENLALVVKRRLDMT